MSRAFSQLKQVLDFFESPAFLISAIDDKLTVVDINDKLTADSLREKNFKADEDLDYFLKISFKFDDASASKFRKQLKLSDSTPFFEIDFEDRSYKFEYKPLDFEDRTFIFVTVESNKNTSMNRQDSEVQFYKRIFDSLPIGISVNRIDDSKTLYVNSEFSKIYGWEFEDLTDVEAFFQNVYPDEQEREEMKNIILRDIESGDPKRMHWKNVSITTKNGKRKIVNAKNIPLYDQNLIISTVTDVTESTRTQRELENAKTRFGLAAQATSDAVWDWDLSDEELYWSDGYERLFGYKIKGNRVSKSFWESKIHPDDLTSFSDSLKEALNDEDLYKWTFDYRFLDNDKNYANVRENVVILRDLSGKPIRLIGALQDITKPLKRENHLNLLEKLVDGTKDAILVTDVKSNSFLNSEIVYVNSSFQRLFECDSSEIIGKTPQEFYVTPKSADMFLELETELSQWNSVDADILSYTKTDLEFWNNLSITPIVNDEGWFTHWMVVNRNVSDLVTNRHKKELLTFTHSAFQGDDSMESLLCKISLKIEDLLKSEFCEFWLKDYYSDALSKALRFKKGEPVDRDSGLLNYRSEDFANEIFKTAKSKLLIHKNGSNSEEKNNIKLRYGFQIRSHEECLGVVILGFDDAYAREKTLTSIFGEFSLQLGNAISRKRTEKEMGIFFEYTPDFLCIFGKNGYLKKINKRACETLGYDEKTILSTPFLNYIKEEDHEKTLALVRKAREYTGYYSDEIRAITKNRKILHVDWTVFSLDEGDKDVFCVGRDITAYKDNLSSLKTQNEKFKILSETVKEAVWDFDLIEERIIWGKGLKTLFGYDPGKFAVAEEVWLEKLHPEDRKRVKASFDSALDKAEENEWREEYRFKKENGSYAYVLDRGTIVRDGEGKAIRMVGSIQDISEYKHCQKNNS
ncbi:PAS domain S-box protein [Psychroflexus sp. YR1-1]|uniref:histidine kinase n=1 Tax=Psychroflexus aurantiacus TaxID=2709310 RepID=A0A6B3QYC5_9FLAO|nr:PAS domain S-box protein [Psychroflexus aurantiacus]NEV92668.1 PAS domain S-box protein [Psychroflexus aurantiacus]